MKISLVLLPGLDGTGDLFKNLLDVMTVNSNTMPIAYPPAAFLAYSELSTWVTRKLPESRPYILLGESFSGPVAVKIAAQKPVNLKGIILCNSFVTSPVAKVWGILPWRWVYSLRPPSWALRRYLVDSTTSDEMCTELRRSIGGVNPGVLAARTREILKVDVREELSSLTIPIMYMRGTRDNVVKKEAMKTVKKYAPHTQIATFAGPHLLLQTMPELCRSKIREFEESCRIGLEV